MNGGSGFKKHHKNNPDQSKQIENDAEEGEIPDEEREDVDHREDSRKNDRNGRDRNDLQDRNDGRRYRPRSRSRSPDNRRSRDHHRSEQRDLRRRSRSRNRDRNRHHSLRDTSRSPPRDHRGSTLRERQLEEKMEKKKQEEENDEEYQARVAAALAAQEQEDDEEKIIEERRRRRQEILAKYNQQQQQQQSTSTPAIDIDSKPTTIEIEEEHDEKKVFEELGTVEGGTLDIWRHDPAPTITTTTASIPDIPASGIGEGHDEELNRRLQATAKAQAHQQQQHQQQYSVDEAMGDGADDMEDIFAATPEDTKPSGQQEQQPSRAAQRGFVDSYDDAEGYYKFQVGEIIGGTYEVFATHGRGVFSSVLRARDLSAVSHKETTTTPPPPTSSSSLNATDVGTVSTREEVAIKIIRANDTMYKAGQTERIILQKLAQADPDGKKHCIRMKGSFEFRNHLCLVFESMDMDLRSLTKRYGRGIGLSLSAVRIYTQQLLVALLHLYNCGVLHADIKPDNILVNDRRTVVKLCDFGSAMFSGDNEITPYLVSRFYRSPEVILGLPYNHPMDMWSIGCVVYELFTGQILFPGKTNNEMLKLFMDVKGPFPKKMIRKAEFAYKHFENDPNVSFAVLEEDAVTKQPLRRLISNPTIKNDFSKLLAGQSGDRRKLNQLADLLERMMVLDPERRITPKDALRHPFIRENVGEGGGKGGQKGKYVAVKR